MFGKDKKKEETTAEERKKERIGELEKVRGISAEIEATHQSEKNRYEKEIKSIKKLNDKELLAEILYELRENKKVIIRA